MMLLDQVGLIRAYKLVTKDLMSPIAPTQGYPTLYYSIGSVIEISECDEDPAHDCGKGLHVATLPWCLSRMLEGYRIMIVEFVAADIACIPNDASGKFRVRRLKVVGEKVMS
jgi:hypothetical protein